MSMRKDFLIFMSCCIIYILIGYPIVSEKIKKDDNISPLISLNGLLLMAGPQGRQFLSSILFIKSSIYYGGAAEKILSVKKQDINIDLNLRRLYDYHYKISLLNPKMIDNYYRAQSTLTGHDNQYLKELNSILDIGLEYLPKSVTIPFFQGYNYKLLGENKKGYEVLMMASKIEGSPRWIRHLAISLMVNGNQLEAGLMWLKGMHVSESSEKLKNRYENEIAIFENGIIIQNRLRLNDSMDLNNDSLINYLKDNKLKNMLISANNNGFVMDYKSNSIYIYRGKK